MAVKFYPAISGIKITKLSTATGVFHHSIYVTSKTDHCFLITGVDIFNNNLIKGVLFSLLIIIGETWGESDNNLFIIISKQDCVNRLLVDCSKEIL